MRCTPRTQLARALTLASILLCWPRTADAGTAPSSRPASATPPYSLRQTGSVWRLVSPAGRPFFSRGACCVTPGAAPAKYDPENPEYAHWKYYPDETAWADATVARLQAWGFTTLGAWSDVPTLRRASNSVLGLTPVLHMGSTAGAPWWDMWDSKVIRRMEDTARAQILLVRDDPRLIGYFSDNELGWWNATLFKMTLEQAPSSGQRQRLIRLLREHYQDDWRRLREDFDAENAEGWASLRRRGMLYLRPGGQGIHVMRRFLGLLAGRYYQLCHDLIRKYDSRALILGDRYQSFYYPEVARACAPYVDAVSSNLNASWNDGTFLRFYLDTLHALTGKPILVSEFYLAARDNRSGNRNDQGVFPVALDQAQRAVAARRTVLDLFRLPYVVGADWFQYFDEPTHGRFDGENFNFGLIDIQDRPYDELTQAFRALAVEPEPGPSAPPRPNAAQGVPPAPADPLAEFTPMSALKAWDRERGWVQPVTEFPLADLYLCWTSRALYLGLYSLDIVEDAYYRDRSLPKSDRPLWEVELPGQPPIRARIGAGREPLVNAPEVRVRNLSGLNLNVRNLAVMEIPVQRLGQTELRPGAELALNITLTTHCQAYRMAWRGLYRLVE